MATKLQLKWVRTSLFLFVYDAVTITAAYFLALWLRFDCHYSEIPKEYFDPYLKFIPYYVIGCIVIYWVLRLYKTVWRFAGLHEIYLHIIAMGICLAFNVLLTLNFFSRMPISYYAFGICFQFFFTVSIRFAYRIYTLMFERKKVSEEVESYAKKVMLIGAGSAGSMILKELRTTKRTKEKVCCIIDDDVNKWNRFIDGVKVVGGRDDIMKNVEKYNIEKIYIAMPSVTPNKKKEILNICKDTGCELQNLPGVYQLCTGEVSINDMKDVAVEDLLGRDQIKVNLDEIFQAIQGKVILVTGGGGSIGSELCRQIAGHKPKQLIIFDIYENNAYDIQLELKRKYPELNLETIIGSVRDSRKIFQIFETYHPQMVYHAAAHKHVPLMEDSPCEAVKNNVIGTYKTAFAAMVNGCEKFVLISTDKAVNPTNIMGASKRLCEMVVQAMDAKVKQGKAYEIPQLFTHEVLDDMNLTISKERLKKAKTEFVAVRFGNVLGSNGSVIPLFKKQIAEGGPVTVTHPDIIRYFMTIPEAVSLVLQAGTYAHGGEIFVLDMGEPVKIDTLARNLIKLSGHRVNDDIKIVYTGLRPGEKLFEEKLMAEEGLKKTKNNLIHIGCPIPFDVEVFLSQIEDLMEAAYKNKEDIRERVADVVTTYQMEKELIS